MDSTPVLASTLLFTILSFIGLFFFIKASVKERLAFVQCPIDPDQSDRLNQLQTYFNQRGYQIIQVNAEKQKMILEGKVRPSLFLALFLTVMTALGLLCLGLVLSILAPDFNPLVFFLVLFSPLAGIFYWQKAARPEQIAIAINPDSLTSNPPLLTISGHRDELKQLKQNFAWPWLGLDNH